MNAIDQQALIRKHWLLRATRTLIMGFHFTYVNDILRYIEIIQVDEGRHHKGRVQSPPRRT